MLRKCTKLICCSQTTYLSSVASKKGQFRITCKRPEFNLCINEQNKAGIGFEKIDLASGGWQHYKSKGDHFILHPLVAETNEFSEKSFEDLRLDERLIKNLKNRYDISTPTVIQAEAIPEILKRRHTLVAAETGCGKSLTFTLPIIQQIHERKHKTQKREFNTPLALIITPGRELATQIGNLIEEMVSGLNLKVKTVLGGRTKQQMLNPSFDDMDVLVATIGAISKLVTNGIMHIDQVRHLVLDEADTLLGKDFV